VVSHASHSPWRAGARRFANSQITNSRPAISRYPPSLPCRFLITTQIVAFRFAALHRRSSSSVLLQSTSSLLICCRVRHIEFSLASLSEPNSKFIQISSVSGFQFRVRLRILPIAFLLLGSPFSLSIRHPHCNFTDEAPCVMFKLCTKAISNLWIASLLFIPQ